MTDQPRRTRPLNARADVAGDEAPDDATVTVVPLEDMLDVGDVVVTPTATAGEAASESEANRYQRLAEGVRGLRAGGGTLNLGERTLMILGGIIAPLGLIVIWIGWNGAAHSPFLFEQVPYLISGIGLGLGLVFLGAFFYFAHWITELVKEGRSQSAALLEAITRLEATVREQAGADRLAMADGVHTNGSTAVADADLVATGKGTMAHRPDCVVVVGKPDLRRVTADEGLVACKLCDPYETPVDA